MKVVFYGGSGSPKHVDRIGEPTHMKIDRKNHTTFETSYPFVGLKKGTIRYWVETDPKKGVRLHYQQGDCLPRASSWYHDLGMEDHGDHFEVVMVVDGTLPRQVEEFIRRFGASDHLKTFLKARVDFCLAQKNLSPEVKEAWEKLLASV